MSKITFVIPYPEIVVVVEQLFQENKDGDWELEVIVASGVREVLKTWDVAADVRECNAIC